MVLGTRLVCDFCVPLFHEARLRRNTVDVRDLKGQNGNRTMSILVPVLFQFLLLIFLVPQKDVEGSLLGLEENIYSVFRLRQYGVASTAVFKFPLWNLEDIWASP